MISKTFFCFFKNYDGILTSYKGLSKKIIKTE
jgi:hypothetical protein